MKSKQSNEDILNLPYEVFLRQLEQGRIRVASFHEDLKEWRVDTRIKQKILCLFNDHPSVALGEGNPLLRGFIDKEPLLPRLLEPSDKVRIVPGGTSIRAGAHIGAHVVLMPPSYVNIGAFVGEGTMIDSHVLVGSCAQIGRRVHLSAAAQIGGVLEPVGQRPVIIEDDCFVGAGAIVTEGILVKRGAVIASGVVISASVPIFDIVHQKIYRGEIPENAVVMPGSRPIQQKWAKEQGLSLQCAVIVKYRDEKTEKSVASEDLLRSFVQV